jgi:hypothetical protein
MIRLHSGSREVDITMATACWLGSESEVAFARTTHAILQRIRVLTLSERTSKHADEIDLTQSDVTCAEVSLLLQVLRIGVGTGGYSARSIASALCDRVPVDEGDVMLGSSEGSGSGSEPNTAPPLAKERAALLLHALDAPSLLLELLLIPIPTSVFLTPAGVVSTIAEAAAHSPSASKGEYACLRRIWC